MPPEHPPDHNYATSALANTNSHISSGLFTNIVNSQFIAIKVYYPKLQSVKIHTKFPCVIIRKIGRSIASVVDHRYPARAIACICLFLLYC